MKRRDWLFGLGGVVVGSFIGALLTLRGSFLAPASSSLRADSAKQQGVAGETPLQTYLRLLPHHLNQLVVAKGDMTVVDMKLFCPFDVAMNSMTTEERRLLAEGLLVGRDALVGKTSLAVHGHPMPNHTQCPPP